VKLAAADEPGRARGVKLAAADEPGRARGVKLAAADEPGRGSRSARLAAADEPGPGAVGEDRGRRAVARGSFRPLDRRRPRISGVARPLRRA
jgi:hypothetical protein